MVAGINAALLKRERTGQGGLVATSLLRAGMYCMGWDIGIHLRFGRLQSTRPRTRQPAPLVNCYRAGDGRGFWLLGLEQDRHWPGLLAALDRPDLGEPIPATGPRPSGPSTARRWWRRSTRSSPAAPCRRGPSASTPTTCGGRRSTPSPR